MYNGVQEQHPEDMIRARATAKDTSCSKWKTMHCQPTLQEKMMLSKQSKPMNVPWKRKRRKKKELNEPALPADCKLNVSMPAASCSVGGTWSRWEANRVGSLWDGFLPYAGFWSFLESTRFELQVNSQRCCCAYFLFWISCIPVDAFFNVKQWWVNMFA